MATIITSIAFPFPIESLYVSFLRLLFGPLAIFCSFEFCFYSLCFFLFIFNVLVHFFILSCYLWILGMQFSCLLYLWFSSHGDSFPHEVFNSVYLQCGSYFYGKPKYPGFEDNLYKTVLAFGSSSRVHMNLLIAGLLLTLVWLEVTLPGKLYELTFSNSTGLDWYPVFFFFQVDEQLPCHFSDWWVE